MPDILTDINVIPGYYFIGKTILKIKKEVRNEINFDRNTGKSDR